MQTRPIRVLSFGNIPTWAGGRNDNGLSNVIYQLALNISQVESVDLTLVATDVYTPSIIRDGLKIVGWTKPLLLKYAVCNPLKVLIYFFYALGFLCKYRLPESCIGLVLKMLLLNKTIKEFAPQIVHLHGAVAIMYLNAIPKSIKTVLTIHGILGNDEHFERYRDYFKLERNCCQSKNLEKIYFISSKLIDDFNKAYGPITPAVEAINNAYDNTVFYIQKKTNPGNDFKLITVATLSNIKGQERVLQAIERTGFDCIYECVGGDSDGLSEKLKSYAKENNIRYFYHGPKAPSEINELLAGADYMILPSSTEGFGLVYLEAMACGVPVVLPKDLPIVQEPGIIIPNVNAVLLEDFTVESIARVLPKLRQMSFDRSAVSRTVSEINWQKMAQKYALSFEKILLS